MGYRNAGEFRRCNGGADAWYDLERNTGHCERQRLFGAAAENKRIPALEPHDTLACACRTNHQTVNRFLADAFTPRALADAEALRVRESTQRRRVNEGVIEHEIGLFEIRNRTLRPEVRVT